jgi:flagellar hook protein FlgE
LVNRYGTAPQIGRPREQAFGKINARSIEMSNVDLSQQFSEMIITQRGYQASSQVITTANEMVQQLLDMRGRR